MKDLVSNVRIYGLDNVFMTAKYPKAVDTDKLNNNLTEGIEKCLMSPAGSGHDNALKGIIVQFDLTCTNKMWVEAERYHFFEIVSSQSTMHKIASFNLSECVCDYVDGRLISVVNEIQAEYNDHPTDENYLKLLYNIPSGFKLTAGITTNYQQLKTIYRQRKNHRLPEWREFCRWVELLPFSYLICGGENEKQ